MAGGARGVQAEPLLPSSQLEEFSLAEHAGEGYFCCGGHCSGFFAGSWFQVRHPPLGCAHITGPTTMAYQAGVTCYAEFLTLGSHSPEQLMLPGDPSDLLGSHTY